ncbi:hypothetical protein [Mannheimia haemolytica]|uniref:hypothetical protein n=1 Tax=Mannheimia haemolytica TaxID=75985 RepID=UPI001EFF4875|nr:hypothetical protein [Mannheimia haemolytica]
MIDEKLFQMLISFVVAPLVAFVGKVIFDRINRNEQTVKRAKSRNGEQISIQRACPRSE